MKNNRVFRPSAVALALGTLLAAPAARALDFADLFGKNGYSSDIRVNELGYQLTSGSYKAGSTIIGYAAPGSVLQFGGDFSTNTFTLGYYSGADGFYGLYGGSLGTNSAQIGKDSAGTFNNIAGLHFNGGLMSIGQAVGAASPASQYLLANVGNLSSERITVNAQGTYRQDGGVALVFGGAFTVAAGGTGALNGGSLQVQRESLTIEAAVRNGPAAGSFAQTGGNFLGTVTNNGSYRYTGGAFNGLLTNGSTGVATIDGDFAPAQGIANSGQVTVGANRKLTVSGSGLANAAGATFVFNGSSIGGSGVITNDGTLQLAGTLGGSGVVTNRGTVTQSGALAITRSGTIDQQGTWSMNGNSLKCCDNGGFANSGLLDMGAATASIGGSGVLVNKATGTLRSAGGSLDVTVQNDGLVQLTGGKLTTTRQLTNSGTVTLSGSDAQLAGTTLRNTGTVQGRGRIDNAVDNQGTVRATLGELLLNGSVGTQGTLAAGSAGTLRIGNGLATNDGTVQLEGGTFDNNGKALTNRGRIVGQGSFIAGALTNARDIQIASGNSSFSGPVTLLAGSSLVVDGSVDFNGSVKFNSGVAWRGTGTSTFKGGLTLADTVATITDDGSVALAAANVLAMDVAATGADKLVVGGTLNYGGKLVLASSGGYVGHLGDTFDLFDWAGGRSGAFAQIDTSALAIADGLRWSTARLYTDGTLTAVTSLVGTPPPIPEPGTWALLSAGLGLLALRRRG